MSEQINKVLASTAQAFSTAEMKQSRDNISAQAKISYSYSGGTITAIDGSAVGNPTAMFTGASANNCISGNGTSGSPLGISSRILFTDTDSSAEYGPLGVQMSASPYTSTHYRVGGWSIYSTGNATHHRSVGANCSGLEINWDTNYYVMRLSASGIETKDAWSPSRHCAWYNYNGAQQSAYDGKTSVWNDHELLFENSASGTARKVDIDSIDRWNSYSANQAGWNESGNPLSTGFGGNPATAASQYNVGAGNWAARTVKASGIPDMDLYGFRNLPVGQGPFGVNGNGAWIDLKPETRWESSFQATSNTYDLLNIPKNATAFINVQGRFDHCSYVNMTTSKDAWLSVTGGGTTAGGGFRTWPLTNITTVAKGGTAENGYTPQLQVVTTGDTTVGFTVNMVIKEA